MPEILANFQIALSGQVPSKKNLYRRGKNGTLFLDRAVKARIDALILQAQSQWRGRPLEHPDLCFRFYVAEARSDRDNKLGCLLDILQEAGVLCNDNIAHSNGRMVIEPAIVGGEEKTVIEIIPQQMGLL